MGLVVYHPATWGSSDQRVCVCVSAGGGGVTWPCAALVLFRSVVQRTVTGRILCLDRNCSALHNMKVWFRFACVSDK